MAGEYPVPGFTHLATARPQGGPSQLGLGAIDVQDVSPRLLAIGEAVGARLRKVVVIFSGYRTDDYSQSVGGFAGDPHSRKIAFDATIDGQPIGSYPGAVELIHSFGARSGATDFSYKGKPDPAHVDLVGSTGATPPATTTKTTATTATRGDFFRAVLAKLGAPADSVAGRRNLDFFAAWGRAEGTKAAYNPLATTLARSGATDFNSVGVKNYASFDQGVDATVETLRNYPAVVGFLRQGQPQAILTTPRGQSELNKWQSGTAKPGYTPYVSNIFKLFTGSGASASDWLSSDLGLGASVKAAAAAVVAVPEFLARITDAHNILRGLQVVAGAVLVLVGVVLLARQVGLAADVPTAVPVPVPPVD